MKPAAPSAVPLLVRLAGRRVAGVGGGSVAAGKLGPLARDHGAAVHVISPTLDPSLTDLVTWSARDYGGPEDLRGAVLVVAATDLPEVNAAVSADAEGLGILCVRTDRGGEGSAAFPATVRRGPLTISVGTDGLSPTVARALREELDARYGPEYAQVVVLLGELREDPDIRARLDRLSESRRLLAWRSIPLADILDHVRSGSVHTAKEVAAACLSSYSD